jgi:quercetin dioxygenase-like cupin family protein
MPKGKANVHLDNEKVKVTEWRLAPGTSTERHSHPHDFVVLPLTTGKLHVETGQGEAVEVELQAGKPFYSDAGAEHDVTNRTDSEFVFIEFEAKR